jgi:hypothetical protein
MRLPADAVQRKGEFAIFGSAQFVLLIKALRTAPAAGEYPNLDHHSERMMARPAVQKTIAIESKIGYNLP